MAKYLLLYNDVDTFESEQNSVDYVNSIVPGVGYVREDQGVRYNRKKGPVLRYTLSTYQANEDFYEPDLENIYEVSVDGVTVDGYPYTIAEEGTHTIEVELVEGTTELVTINSAGITGAMDIYVPEGITEVKGGFTGVGTGSGMLGKLHLPSTLQSIGGPYDAAFTSYYGGPDEITCLATIAPTINVPQTEFLGFEQQGTLYYPAGSDYSSWLEQLNTSYRTWTGVEI